MGAYHHHVQEQTGRRGAEASAHIQIHLQEAERKEVIWETGDDWRLLKL